MSRHMLHSTLIDIHCIHRNLNFSGLIPPPHTLTEKNQGGKLGRFLIKLNFVQNSLVYVCIIWSIRVCVVIILLLLELRTFMHQLV